MFVLYSIEFLVVGNDATAGQHTTNSWLKTDKQRQVDVEKIKVVSLTSAFAITGLNLFIENCNQEMKTAKLSDFHASFDCYLVFTAYNFYI